MPVISGGYGRFTQESFNVENLKQADGGAFSKFTANPVPNDGPAKALPDLSQNFSTAAGASSKLYPGVDFSKFRLQNSGLNVGGANSPKSTAQAPQVNSGVTSTALIPTEDDWRVRVSLPTNSRIFYQDPGAGQLALKPIIDSGVSGVVFPYVPAIQVAHNARYSEQALTHSNYKNYFYEGSDVAAITITGEFSAQNEKEAAYVLACVYFLRACTKMFFGQSSSLPVGTPPTIVYLDGFGQFYFPHVSCVITNFTHTLPADVDYIPLKTSFNNTRVPTMSSIGITLQPVYSRKRIHEDYNLDQIAQGLLLGNKKGVGGFL
jgi:hypothetical protein